MKIKYQNMAIFFLFFPSHFCRIGDGKITSFGGISPRKKKGSYGSKCSSLAANFFLDKVRDLAKRNFKMAKNMSFCWYSSRQIST